MIKIFNKTLTEHEKYLLYKIAEKNAQSIVAKNLYVKPFLIRNLNLKDIYYLHLDIYYNYLLKKLYVYNYKYYINYYNFILRIKKEDLEVKQFVIFDYKIYKLLWENICSFSYPNHLLYNDTPVIYTTSLIETFEEFLEPLPYLNLYMLTKKLEFQKNNSNEVENSNYVVNDIEPIYIKKRKFNYRSKKHSIQSFFSKKDQLYKFSEVKNILEKEPFSNEDERLLEKFEMDIEREEEIESQLNIIPFKLRRIRNNFYCEASILLQNINENPYQYIDLQSYFSLLTKLNFSNVEIQDQLYLSKYHNDILIRISKETRQNFNIIKSNMKLKNTNFGKTEYVNMHYLDIKNIEEKKVLSEISLYYEILLKNVVEFIELFLFKFINYIDVSKLLPLFYSGIENKENFYNFYNLLCLELKKIQKILNVYSISFIVEYLEFIYMCTFYAGVNTNYFKYSINNIRNVYGFKNLKIFEFNFWVTCKLFVLNDDKSFLSYYTTTYSYNNIQNFFKYYITLFSSSKEVDLKLYNVYSNHPNLDEVNGFDFNTHIYDTSQFLELVQLYFAKKRNILILHKPKFIFRFTKDKQISLIACYDYTLSSIKKYSKLYLENPIKKFFYRVDNELVCTTYYRLTFPIFQSYNIYRLQEYNLITIFSKVFFSPRNKKFLTENLIIFKKNIELIFTNYLNNRQKFFLFIISKVLKNDISVNILDISSWTYKNFTEINYPILLNFHENLIHFAVVMQLYQNKNKIFALKDSKHDIKDMPYIKMKSELDNLIYEVKTGH